MKDFTKGFWFWFLFYVLVFVAAFVARLLYNTWHEKKRIARIVRGLNWQLWISRVKELLGMIDGVDPDDIMDRHAEWFHELWKKDPNLYPQEAVNKWLVEKTTRGVWATATTTDVRRFD